MFPGALVLTQLQLRAAGPMRAVPFSTFRTFSSEIMLVEQFR
jgi:hypothetical protein